MVIFFSLMTCRKIQSNKRCYYVCHHVYFRCRTHTANNNYFNILFRCSRYKVKVILSLDKDHNKKTYPEVKVRTCAFSGAKFDESLWSAPSFSRFRPVGGQAGLKDNVDGVTKNIYRCLRRELNLDRPVRTYPLQILICITYNWSVMQFLCTELYTCLDKLLAIVSKQG